MKKIKNPAPASAASSSTTSAASRRGQKTLGWFLSEELIEKTATSSPSPPVQARHQQQTTSSTTNMAGGAAAVSAEEKKRRRGGRGHRQRKLTESLSTASEASLPMMLEGDEDKKDTTLTGVPASDFYVYDVASDGYYYEQNGAKGWRRRLPQGVQPKKPTGTAAAAAAASALQQQQQNEELQRQAEAAAAAALQRNHMNALQAAMAQPTAYNRYYDAPSDGYFFEMASVDGWRKRTAAPSAGAPAAFGRVPAARGGTPTAGGAAGSGLYNGGVPLYAYAALQQQQAAAAAAAAAAALPSQSYGAALARGELPAKCMIESSASSSVSDDLSYPSLSRPTSLDLTTMAAFGAAGAGASMERRSQHAQAAAQAAQIQEAAQDAALFHWNADKFIEELVGQFSSGSRLDAFTDSFGGVGVGENLKTPATSMWHRRFSTTTTSSTSGAVTGGEEEDQEEYALTKELENIWKTPTPVQN